MLVTAWLQLARLLLRDFDPGRCVPRSLPLLRHLPLAREHPTQAGDLHRVRTRELDYAIGAFTLTTRAPRTAFVGSVPQAEGAQYDKSLRRVSRHFFLPLSFVLLPSGISWGRTDRPATAPDGKVTRAFISRAQINNIKWELAVTLGC